MQYLVEYDKEHSEPRSLELRREGAEGVGAPVPGNLCLPTVVPGDVREISLQGGSTEGQEPQCKVQ